MQIQQILFYISAGFMGFAAGRIGHIYWGYLRAPHHWIYGFILIILGSVFRKYSFGLPAFFFGAGLYISDFKDFLKLKIIDPDKPGEKKFWGID